MAKHIYDDSTTVGQLLNQHAIGLRVIGRAAEVGPATVHRVLSKTESQRCLPTVRRAVRNAIESLLRAYHWRGTPDDLWSEFDDESSEHEVAA